MSKLNFIISFDCQSMGLAPSLELICPHAKFIPLPQYQLNNPKVVSNVQNFTRSNDVCWIGNDLEKEYSSLLHSCKYLNIPFVSMDKFYPDLGGVLDFNLKGKYLEKYHSILLFTLFQMGVSRRDAINFFSPNFFAECGFINAEFANKEIYFNSFNSIDNELVTGLWRDLCRNSKTFHTSTHPSPIGFKLIAECYARIINLNVVHAENLDVDDSLGYLRWARYPGLELLTGTKGSFTWKMKNGLIFRNISEFIDYYYDDIYGKVSDDVIQSTKIGNSLGFNSTTMRTYVAPLL